MVRMKHVLYAVGIAAALVGPAAARADAATVTVSVNAQLLTINQSGDPQICPEGAMTCTSSLAGAEVKAFAATPASAAGDLVSLFNSKALGSCITMKDGTCTLNVPVSGNYVLVLRWQDPTTPSPPTSVYLATPLAPGADNGPVVERQMQLVRWVGDQTKWSGGQVEVVTG